ncbi:MAG: restriction endonuclease subunit S [Caldilineaceae bacterium]|nr:restriction endonuclease subunit S [Caldilineaceae bacterium]
MYATYKPSGLDWLGDIPAHWALVQLGRIGRFSKGSGGTKADEVPDGVPCIRYGDLYTSHKYHIRTSRSCVTETNALNYTPLRFGDVLFAGSGETIEEIGKSAVNLIEQPAVCGGDVILFRPESELNAAFSGYAIDCPASQYQKSTMGRGITVMHIYGSELKNLWLPLPPLPEQTAIARYLDHVDRRIQRYIDTKEKLIALLQEARQANIHRAVTRGLDPDVPLKPSGVDWLGDVPAHWEVRKLRYLAHITTGERDTVDRKDDGKYPFFVRSQTVERIDTWSYDGEAVLTAGDGVGVGKVFHYVNGKFDFHQRVYKFCDFGSVIGKFFFHYFKAMLRFEVLQGTAKSTVDSLRLPMLQNLPVAIPPLPEQRAIAAHLDKATDAIDAAIDTARRQADLMREYRASLIAHVVTGKLDVRAAAEHIGMKTSYQ